MSNSTNGTKNGADEIPANSTPRTTAGPADRTVIVTGGNTGLGLECARTIAASFNGADRKASSPGVGTFKSEATNGGAANSGAKATGEEVWQVVIASRDRAKGEAAAQTLRNETGNPNIVALPLDLASLVSVRQFVDELRTKNLPPLRAIVANAGTSEAGGLSYTQDGFETTFGVNHLGHFLLINLLLPHLVAPARVVVVSSGTHDPTKDGKISKPDYRNARALAYPEADGAPRLPGLRRYATSKLANMFFTYELVRRLENAGQGGITAVAYDPGYTPGTALLRQYPGFFVKFMKSGVLEFVFRMLRIDVSDLVTSGRAMARLVLDPALEGVTAKYFHIFKEMPSSTESYDRSKASELWESSAELVKLAPTETVV